MQFYLEKDTILSTAAIQLASKAWQVVFDEVRAKTGGEELDETALEAPRQWRATYSTVTLEFSINVDGLADFFENTDGKLNATLVEDLQLIEALPYVPLFTQAREIFDRIDPFKSGSWDLFREALAPVEEAFYREIDRKPISSFLGEFIKSHPEMFSK